MKKSDQKITTIDAANITTTTAENGDVVDLIGYERIALDVAIDSTGSPDRIRLRIETRMDSDDDWKEFNVGFAAAMYWEDTLTASGLREIIPIDNDFVEDQIRVVAEAEGTVDGSNYWDVTVKVIRYALS